MNVFILNHLLYTKATVLDEVYAELLLAESLRGFDVLFEETNSDPLLTEAFNLLDESGDPLVFEGNNNLVVAD